ncbi:MAG: hypothetical protein NE334_08935 [Lentisphaeraceae bacterium]|nr:hypothetical protein [Lentisphaeraceae bacterium]
MGTRVLCFIAIFISISAIVYTASSSPDCKHCIEAALTKDIPPKYKEVTAPKKPKQVDIKNVAARPSQKIKASVVKSKPAFIELPITGRFLGQIPLSNLETVEEKVEYILAGFSLEKGIPHNSNFYDQMVAMGEEVIPYLLDELDEEKNWKRRLASQFTLSKIFDKNIEDNKEHILKYFKEKLYFVELIEKHKIPEAEEHVFDLISENEVSRNRSLSTDLMHAAINYDEDRALEIFRRQIKDGMKSASLTKILMERYEEIDLSNELRSASQKATSFHDRFRLSEYSLKQGMKEGVYDTVELLKNEETVGRHKQEIVKRLRKVTSFKGSSGELLSWFVENHYDLEWNPDIKKFE